MKPARMIAAAKRAHRRCDKAVKALGPDDVAAPSALPGWTRGHVITHIARNADAMRRVTEAGARGEPVPMYPGGDDERVEDIEAGAARPLAALRKDVSESARALEAAWDAVPDERWRDAYGFRLRGPATLSDFLFLRWRETSIHTVDLAVPSVEPRNAWAALDPAYLDEEWRWTTPGLAARVPETHTLILAPPDRPSRAFGTGREVVIVRDPLPETIAWLTGRADGAIELKPWG